MRRASQREPDGRALGSWRETWFATLNYPAERSVERISGSDQHGDVAMAVAFPDHPVWGETHVYMRMFERYARVHAIAFATTRAVEAPAQTLLVVPDVVRSGPRRT